MFSSEVVPPGTQFDKSKNCLSSVYADYYVRYRQTPLGVEVVSECKGQLCGPTVLVRLPDDGFSQDALTYYMAPSSGVASVPAAFSSAAEVIKAGWRPETFKAVWSDTNPSRKRWQSLWIEDLDSVRFAGGFQHLTPFHAVANHPARHVDGVAGWLRHFSRTALACCRHLHVTPETRLRSWGDCGDHDWRARQFTKSFLVQIKQRLTYGTARWADEVI
jgi:hypothetical protein